MPRWQGLRGGLSNDVARAAKPSFQLVSSKVARGMQSGVAMAAQSSTSKTTGNPVAAAAVVIALLLAGGYCLITWYAVSRFDLPGRLVLEFERPWAIASVLLAGTATFALHHGYRRLSLGLASCAIGGPFAVVFDFLSSLSAPFAG